jgi:tetratricopeptide (TPR) repeat protein
VEAQGLMDANLRKAMGDLFFDNGLYERSMVEYQKILATDANRRDVVVRVARFYEVTGDDAAKKENLEAARDAYAKALEADKLHPDAQRKLLNVEAKIFARDERKNSQKSSIDQARALENRAEEAAARRDFAQAISLLKEADARYAEVTDEFALESKDANTGRRTVQMRTKELKQQLIDNSASLSGTSTAFDVRQIAGQAPNVSEDALKQMLQSEYLGAVKALGKEMDQAQP